MGTAINLNLASMVGGGGSWWPFKFVCFLKNVIPGNLDWCDNCTNTNMSVFALLSEFTLVSTRISLINDPVRVCVGAWIHVHFPTHLPHLMFQPPSLLPVYTVSQVWKLADTWPRELIILDPAPITPHYPLCVDLSGGERCNNGATWKSAQSPNGRSCVTASPREPR